MSHNNKQIIEIPNIPDCCTHLDANEPFLITCIRVLVCTVWLSVAIVVIFRLVVKTRNEHLQHQQDSSQEPDNATLLHGLFPVRQNSNL